MTYVLTSICLLLQIEVILCYSVLTNSAPFLPAIYFVGAAVLTAAGLITRIMGFFFRIFLSHAFGEENVGLYQLIFPVYALCLSVSTFGIQTAVSHMVAEKMSSVVTYSAASSSSPHIERQKEAGNILAVSLGFTLFLSLVELYFLQKKRLLYSNNFFRRCQV